MGLAGGQQLFTITWYIIGEKLFHFDVFFVIDFDDKFGFLWGISRVVSTLVIKQSRYDEMGCDET
jgi:hypothetical protein